MPSPPSGGGIDGGPAGSGQAPEQRPALQGVVHRLPPSADEQAAKKPRSRLDEPEAHDIEDFMSEDGDGNISPAKGGDHMATHFMQQDSLVR